jgi:hypothetical protein
MQVKTQPFKEALEIKSEGISFDIYGNGAKRLGDLSVTKAGLIWSTGANGKAPRGKGINVKWEDFISWVQSQSNGARNGVAAKPSAQNGNSLAKLSAAKTGTAKAKGKSSLATAKKPASAGPKAGISAAKKAN